MLRLLIKILRPTKAELNKRKPSFSLKSKIWSHRCLVKMLAHFYRRYAIYDILSMNDGARIEIEFRDPEFELEVACAKLETKQQLQPLRVMAPKSTQRRRRIRLFNQCFNWLHKVTVTYATGKTIVIDHTTSQMSISGNMRIRAEQAKPDSMINTLRLTQSMGSQRTNPAENQQDETPVSSVPTRPARRQRRRVPPPSNIPASVTPGNKSVSMPGAQEMNPDNNSRHSEAMGDITLGPIPSPAIEETEKPVQVTTRPLKKMKGFDMDDSF